MSADQMNALALTEVPGGGVASAEGFAAAGVHAGFRANPHKRDLALVVADEPCPTAAVFTRNVFCAAPVRRNKRVLESAVEGESCGIIRAVAVNSGNANAATGEEGLAAAEEAGRIVAEAVGCPPDEVLVCSTGVIGVQLPLEPFRTGVPEVHAALSRAGGADAAAAIMTTDTVSKQCAVSFSGDAVGHLGCVFTVGGMAKGSGMIMPDMATMIAVITTDVPLTAPDARAALKRAADVSFNKVTVDSDTSTNDTCILMASGAAAPGSALFQPGSPAFQLFEAALEEVCVHLARSMAKDGEGATKLVDVHVTGARTQKDADVAARTVANSPLVKTAIAGHDANWGRIAAALGRSGAVFRQEDVDISIMGIPVCKGGLALEFDEEEALRRFEEPEIALDINLGAGDASTTVWTCDLTHDYITINGDYRT